MKKVLFVFCEMGTGGAQKIEAFVANAMCEAGYQIEAIDMGSNDCTVGINPQIVIEKLPYKTKYENSKLLRPVWQIVYLFRLRAMIKSRNPDLVCAFVSSIVRITTLAMIGMNIPIVGSERGDPSMYTHWQLQKYGRGFRRCSGVVFQLPQVAKEYNLPTSIKQGVISNPCFPRAGVFKKSTTDNSGIITAAGRLVPEKRFDVLLNAFQKLLKCHPEYKLKIYGDGPLKSELQQLAASLKIERSVFFMGDKKDVFADAVDSEFFVLSSDFEGIPNVLIEAMATGIPCIATDCGPGGARFLLQDGARGLLTPRGDSDELAKAMIRYIEDPSLRVRCRTEAFKVMEDFAPNKIKKQWVDFFDDFQKVGGK